MISNAALDQNLRRVKMGKYKVIGQAFRRAVLIDVRGLGCREPSVALQELLQIPGVGPKSARMVLLYAFPKHANLWAVLDTHVLRWLRERGYVAPKATPSGNQCVKFATILT